MDLVPTLYLDMVPFLNLDLVPNLYMVLVPILNLDLVLALSLDLVNNDVYDDECSSASNASAKTKPQFKVDQFL